MPEGHLKSTPSAQMMCMSRGRFEVFQVDDFTADDEYVTGEQIAEGSLKWDGCCNINFQRWLHFCRPDQAQLQTGGLMAKLYELGASCFGPENFE
jgi:hypothetical protein